MLLHKEQESASTKNIYSKRKDGTCSSFLPVFPGIKRTQNAARTHSKDTH